MSGSNIKAASPIPPQVAGQIIAWLDQQREGPNPPAPTERVQVYTLKDVAVAFIGDRSCAIFDGENNG